MKEMKLKDFLSKFDKNSLENLILQLESAITKDVPEKERLVQEAFREIHSLKGTASFIRVKSLVELLHSIEDSLGVISGNIHQIGEIKDPTIFDTFLVGLDVLEDLAVRLNERPYFDMRDSPELLHRYMGIVAIGKTLSANPGHYFGISELDTDLF